MTIAAAPPECDDVVVAAVTVLTTWPAGFVATVKVLPFIVVVLVPTLVYGARTVASVPLRDVTSAERLDRAPGAADVTRV